jgi:para-aminobenzoate synthetase component 1
MSLPLVHEIAYQDPCRLFAHFKDQEGAVFLDSAQMRPLCGHYSFIALDPFCVFSAKNGVLTRQGQCLRVDPIEFIRQELAKFSQATIPELPPFQGGFVGYWGYELAQHLEPLPLAARDEMHFPDLIAGLYDVVLAFDQYQQRAWIFSCGFPALQEKERNQRAEQRLAAILQQIQALAPLEDSQQRGASVEKIKIVSNFSPDAYVETVQKTIDYIFAGDIFQANISQCFSADLPKDFSAFALYQRLRELNPAPFAAYLHFANTILASASPERFLKLQNGEVETRPIKGTCPRGKSPEDDRALAQALLKSEKDRAENIMIVDLMRNDLSRVCEDHSVQVPQLCGLESYATVHHLVSVVRGKLLAHLSALDLLKASFPGGSVTGAPKLRAMEIIAELEPTQRGPYCGCIAYLGFDGNMDTAITIRTFCIRNNRISFQAGGAIVADSCPNQEYAETLLKARALFKALAYDFTY